MLNEQNTLEIKKRAIQGSFWLMARRLLGLAVGFAGAVLLTRCVGPSDYGVWVSISRVFDFCTVLAQWGVGTYLVRYAGSVSQELINRCFSFAILAGIAITCTSVFVSAMLINLEVVPNYYIGLIAMFAWLPLERATIIPRALMERELRYYELAKIELLQQVTFYSVSLPLAIAGFSFWAIIGGWWAQNLLGLIMFYRETTIKPAFVWDKEFVRELVGYGLKFNGANLTNQAKLLVNPLLVGKLAGSEAVGVIALGQRLIELACVSRTIFGRIVLSVLPKLQSSTKEVGEFLRTSMLLQACLIGTALVVLNLLAPLLVPRIWNFIWWPVLEILPLLSLAAFIAGVVSPLVQALYVWSHFRQVIVNNLWHIGMLGVATFFLVPNIGIVGYAWAEIIALTTNIFLWRYLVQQFSGKYIYR